ncbi:tol-pal system YbgF family protein [uncultured Sphingomonas sp.]|uniref:tol-pal system YbgF family protein n=1 Tax=uncultured Sphingomonas sp. TaxID=158754 RepID=UPI0035CB6D3B
MRRYSLAVLAASATLLPGAATAQASLDGRVGKLESEMHAVQRKVFPGGANQTVQPDIAPPSATGDPSIGTPASSPVADLTARVGSLEQQMATVTGQAEQNQYKLRLMQEQFDAYKRTTDARFATLATGAPTGAPAATAGGGDDALPTRMPPAKATRGGGNTGGSTRSGAARDSGPAKATRDPEHADAVAAVEKPATGDATEDAYLYGYRLWQAKLYPEAETQLKKVVADYPRSRRASYAQNLLGRSYLDEGKPSLASMAFYDNYKKMPDGERAPESLLYLGQSLTKLDKPADACKVYSELTDVYGGKISAGMKADVAKGRAAAKCQ